MVRRVGFWILLILVPGVLLLGFHDQAPGAADGGCRLPERPVVHERNAAESLPVLVYHTLAPESEGVHRTNMMVIPTEAFAAQVQWLRKNGYYTPTLAEVEAFLAGDLLLPRKSVLITFDDGYEANFHYAHPILCEAGFRAVLFRIGNREPKGRPFEPTRHTYLTWEQVAVMQQSGIWTIQNHSFAGHDLDEGVAPYLRWSVAEVEADLRQASHLFEEHEVAAPTAVAYPFGSYDTDSLLAAERAGLRLGFTVEPGRVRPGMDPLRLPRLAVFPYTSLREITKMVEGQ